MEPAGGVLGADLAENILTWEAAVPRGPNNETYQQATLTADRLTITYCSGFFGFKTSYRPGPMMDLRSGGRVRFLSSRQFEAEGRDPDGMPVFFVGYGRGKDLASFNEALKKVAPTIEVDAEGLGHLFTNEQKIGQVALAILFGMVGSVLAYVYFSAR